MAGDRIIMVNDTLIAGVKMKNTDVMKRLRGPKNDNRERVKVLRNNKPDLIEFKITRGKIPVYSLDAAYMADKNYRIHQTQPLRSFFKRRICQGTREAEETGDEKSDPRLAGQWRRIYECAIDLADEFLPKGSPRGLYTREMQTAA
jgi:carboxyl-terminal processing protease